MHTPIGRLYIMAVVPKRKEASLFVLNLFRFRFHSDEKDWKRSKTNLINLESSNAGSDKQQLIELIS